MIYTLTANPAIDYNISSDGLAPNCVTRTRDAVYSPNGKGLNVSFALHHFGMDTAILGFFAGFSGRFIVDGARAKGVDVHPVWTDGITRVNVFLHAADCEYNMVNAGASITPEDEDAMLHMIEELRELDCLSISGSLPPGTSDDFLARAVRTARERGADIVLDISSSQLAELIAERPLLIKPNEDELRDIFGLEVVAGDDEGAVAALDALHDAGAQAVLLTLGGEGAYFSDGANAWYARCTVPVHVLSTACAGDSALAAFLSVWYRDRSRVDEALRLAMATGANVVECAGQGDFARVETYRTRVEVRRVRSLGISPRANATGRGEG